MIGVSAYPEKRLTNPVSDARRVHAVLQDRGFVSSLLLDPYFDTFCAQLDVFSQTISENDFCLVYYAGHGMEVNCAGFVQPVDFPHPFQARLLRHRAISIVSLLRSLEHTVGPKVLILDACRIPFDNFDYDEWQAVMKSIRDSRAPGVPQSNTLIGFSTTANEIALDGKGTNSVYCEQFCSELLRHGLSVEECFKNVSTAVSEQTGGKQQPWYYSSLAKIVTFSHLNRYVLDVASRLPSAGHGAILSLSGNNTLEDVYLSDGGRTVWRVNGTSFRSVATLNEGRLSASALLPSGEFSIMNTDSMIHTDRMEKVFDAGIPLAHGFAWSPSGSVVAIYGASGFGIFKLSAGILSEIFRLETSTSIYCCCFVNEHDVLFGSDSSLRRVINLNSYPEHHIIFTDAHKHFYSISLLETRGEYAVSTSSGQIYWFEIASDKYEHTTDLPNVVQSIAARRSALFNVALDNVIDAFEHNPSSLRDDVRKFLEEQLPANQLLFAAVSPDQSLIAVTSIEGTVYTIDTQGRELVQTIEEPSGRGLSGDGLCFLSRGRMCLVTSDSTINIFRPVTPSF